MYQPGRRAVENGSLLPHRASNDLQTQEGTDTAHALDAILLRDELEKRKQLEAVQGGENEPND
jgi:hypothetical protein